MTDSQLLYRVAFGSLKGMNCRLAAELLARTGSEEIFFTTATSQLKSLLGFDNRLLEKDYRDEVLEQARRELDFINNNNVKVIYFTDEEAFPHRLTECDDAPALLYGIGENTLNSTHVISIVGTRHATVYGVGFVKELIEHLSRVLKDVVIVSGLAYGIDVSAHQESLRNGLPTVGVLAHGLSMIYPAMHRAIAAKMATTNGLLLTDYRHDASISKGNFVARNRIVAGLADCTIVVESAEKGGAMITADIASGYSRDVFALPGRVSDQYSRGCNRLINENKALLIQSPDDILEFMGWEVNSTESSNPKLFYQPTPEEQKIIEFLERNGDAFINRISVDTGVPMHRLMALLVDMEFKGLILNQPGGLYRLK